MAGSLDGGTDTSVVITELEGVSASAAALLPVGRADRVVLLLLGMLLLLLVVVRVVVRLCVRPDCRGEVRAFISLSLQCSGSSYSICWSVVMRRRWRMLER